MYKLAPLRPSGPNFMLTQNVVHQNWAFTTQWFVDVKQMNSPGWTSM